MSGPEAGPVALMIVDVAPTRARWHPGEEATVRVVLHGAGARGPRRRVRVTLLDQASVVATNERVVPAPATHAVVDLTLRLPPDDARGYHLLAEVLPERGDGTAAGDEQTGDAHTRGSPEAVLARRTGALLVASHWRLAPRYGFLSEFGPQPDAEVKGDASPDATAGQAPVAPSDARSDARPDALDDRVAQLARFHVTCVQFYDWMYRHYELHPPAERYRDGMGRALSLATIRRRIDACRRYAMAPIAYGAVYGAEPEYAEAHDEEVLRDAGGRRLALIERFFILDPRPGPWRQRLLREYERAVSELGFAGIHMDQYGTPKRAFAAAGDAVDLAPALRDLIDEAADRLARLEPPADVLFNAVNDWPIDAVAGSRQAAAYIEVWPPHDRYADLVALARRARDLSGKQVVLAAYLRPFVEGGPAAETAARLTTAVIASAGAHHLLLGEGTAVLRDPYYPNHGRLGPDGIDRMRRYYDHTAALHHYLFAPERVDVSRAYATGENAELELTGAPVSTTPEAGTVWLSISTVGPGLWVLNLVNLVGATDALWNLAKQEPPEMAGLRLVLGPFLRRAAAVWSSPDADGPPTSLTATRVAGGGTGFELPVLRTWATIVMRDLGPASSGAT